MIPGETAVGLVTAPEDAAPRMAMALVEERLAACVNLVPGVRSVYRWKGRTEEATVPKILGFGATAGHRPYREWVGESVAAKGGE